MCLSEIKKIRPLNSTDLWNLRNYREFKEKKTREFKEKNNGNLREKKREFKVKKTGPTVQLFVVKIARNKAVGCMLCKTKHDGIRHNSTSIV